MDLAATLAREADLPVEAVTASLDEMLPRIHDALDERDVAQVLERIAIAAAVAYRCRKNRPSPARVRESLLAKIVDCERTALGLSELLHAAFVLEWRIPSHRPTTNLGRVVRFARKPPKPTPILVWRPAQAQVRL